MDELAGGTVTAEALWTTKRLAEELAVSERTVQRRLKAAGIAPVRIAQGVPQYDADVLEGIAEPSGQHEETALATSASTAMTVAIEALRAAQADALAAERARVQDALDRLDREREAQVQIERARENLAAELERRAEAAERERDQARAELAEAQRRLAATPPPARGFWARLLGG